MKKVREQIEEQEEVKEDTSSRGASSRACEQEPKRFSSNCQAFIAPFSALRTQSCSNSTGILLIHENEKNKNTALKELTLITNFEARYRHRWSGEKQRCRGTKWTRCASKNAKYYSSQEGLSFIYLFAIFGCLLSVIISKDSGIASARQASFQEYLLNSDQTSSISSNRPKLGLLDQTTASDGILVQTKQGIFKGKLIESNRRDKESTNKVKVIGFLGKLIELL